MDGELTLTKPDISSDSFETKVFDKYSTVEKALNAVIANSIINNLGVNVSPEYVSSLNKELDSKVKEFLETRI